ncbi:acyl-CoA/acyl-ACP dehydrogenase [Tessaracoccus antarcticus]|uniref:Acyl-CoA dehydrogenase n=1 Tax=Tessaracoccus antarcticus TaxID=2479848 RepID=A0A3M0GCQ8_9ACTN|nr:acyl-CoA/acyl-ACP dehydrogenase [Tessaracoccus antarcticus]RMB58909.1 acyl-CoA dehydrogenase [Tessaracoccus antarcticus]
MVTFNVDVSAAPPDGWALLMGRAAMAFGDPGAALRLAPEVAGVLPLPGSGRTRVLWEGLADLGSVDLTVARTLEPHLDAMAILDQAAGTSQPPPVTPPGSTWGVFAAEGPGARLEAHGPSDEPQLRGRKPWCSLAGVLSHALVSAWTGADQRQLFAVDLRHPGVRHVEAPWVARGLSAVTSGAIDFDGVPAHPVGPAGWYLERPGFAWGGIGVAAVWWGGAAGLVQTMREAATRRPPDQVGRMLLGQADAALHAAAAVLEQAATAVDAGVLQGGHAWPRTLRVRHVVHEACELSLRAAAHALGPGPLTADEDHARRVSDLEVYLRQHRAQRDAVTIGDGLIDGMGATWG